MVGDIAQKIWQIEANLLSYVTYLGGAAHSVGSRKTDKNTEKFMNIQEFSKKLDIFLIPQMISIISISLENDIKMQ